MAAKDLRGETNLTKCLAMGSKKGTMWHARLRGRTSGLCAVSQPRPRGLGGMQIVDHMLPFMPLSLFVSALSLSRSGAQSKVDKVLGETKGAAASYPQCDAYCSEQLWKCQTGLR